MCTQGVLFTLEGKGTILIGARDRRQKFAEILGRAGFGGEVAVVERSGKPMAAIIPIEMCRQLVAEREARFRIIEKIRTTQVQRSQDELEEDDAAAIKRVRAGKYTISDQGIKSVFNFLQKDALLVSGQTEVKGAVPEDPDDEKFLSIALEGDAQIILSGDKHLLELGRYRNITVQTAPEFIDPLNRAASR